jgi:hypothetical protein
MLRSLLAMRYLWQVPHALDGTALARYASAPMPPHTADASALRASTGFAGSGPAQPLQHTHHPASITHGSLNHATQPLPSRAWAVAPCWPPRTALVGLLVRPAAPRRVAAWQPPAHRAGSRGRCAPLAAGARHPGAAFAQPAVVAGGPAHSRARSALYCDHTRLLPETDPHSRQIMMSQGTFLEVLHLAALQQGLRADIGAVPATASSTHAHRRRRRTPTTPDGP